MTQQQRDRVFKIQENLARLLADKCKFNNQRNRYAKLIEVVTEFRSGKTSLKLLGFKVRGQH